MTVIPGLIDGHTHLANYFSAQEFLPYAMAGGTTCMVTETLEANAIAGLDGVIDFILSYQEQPVKGFFTAPVMISISKEANGIPENELDILLNREDVLGLGEVYWQSLLQDSAGIMPLMNQALALGKTVEGGVRKDLEAISPIKDQGVAAFQHPGQGAMRQGASPWMFPDRKG